MAELIKDTEGEVTHIFPRVEGESEEQVQAKINAGYTELPQFEGKADDYHYNCLNCEYMKPDKQSPTGYMCSKFGFYDAPHGCSDGWELRPELREYEDSEETIE